jgi:hypothetical protein
MNYDADRRVDVTRRSHFVGRTITLPRGISGSGTRTRARRATSTTSTRQRASPSSSTAQQIIWQGACLDGQHLFQLTRSGQIWQLYELNFTGANTASRKMVTTQPMFIDAFAAIGSQYAMLIGSKPGAMRLANRSVRATAGNAIPSTVAEPIAASNAVATRRVRRRVSVNRSTPATAATAV